MNLLITGSTGFVGNSLLQEMFNNGYTVSTLTRNKKFSEEDNNEPYWNSLDLDKDVAFDVILHLAGENVASDKWSEKKKEKILNSRIDSTSHLIDLILSRQDKPKVFLCASAAGYYGSRGDEMLDEKSSLGKGFLAEVCQQWENETLRLRQEGVRVVNLRFGMILGPDGGALTKMIPPFKKGVGGVIGSGRQYMSWISLRDIPFILDHIIHHDEISGPVNMVSPQPVQNREFTKSLGRALGVRTFMKVPSFVVKTVFGQMGAEMLLASSRVTPRVLLQSGYKFVDTNLDNVLRYCIDGDDEKS